MLNHPACPCHVYYWYDITDDLSELSIQTENFTHRHLKTLVGEHQVNGFSPDTLSSSSRSSSYSDIVSNNNNDTNGKAKVKSPTDKRFSTNFYPFGENSIPGRYQKLGHQLRMTFTNQTTLNLIHKLDHIVVKKPNHIESDLQTRPHDWWSNLILNNTSGEKINNLKSPVKPCIMA